MKKNDKTIKVIAAVLFGLLLIAVTIFFVKREPKIQAEVPSGKDSVINLYQEKVELISDNYLEDGSPGSGAFLFNIYDSSYFSGISFLPLADTIPYLEYEGRKIFQGDIILGESINPNSVRQVSDSIQVNKDVSFLNAMISRVEIKMPISQPQKNKIFAVGLKAINRKWPNGKIFYSIHSDLRTKAGEIKSAIDMWQKRVPEITFVLFDTLLEKKENYVEFVPGGYGSYVGMQGGRQELQIELNPKTGKIAHEIGHLLGLFHEHSHPNRDHYISIAFENIDKRKGIPEQFLKLNSTDVDTTSYDFGSIMQYPALAFSINNLPTIKVLPQYSGKSIGQRTRPSELDIKQVRKIYKK